MFKERRALGDQQPAGQHFWLLIVRSWPVAWLLRELHLLLRALREWTLAAALLTALLLWSLAYQSPFITTLHIGGDAVSHRREDDAPFLRGFHGSEPDVRGEDWWTLPPGYGYRWTQADSAILLPGIGAGTWTLALTASGHADGSPAMSEWRVGDQHLSMIIAPAPRTYRLIAHTDAVGDLQLLMHTTAYTTTVDSRPLGFALRQVVVAPATTGLHVPALGQLVWLALILTMLYLLARRLAIPIRWTFALALACATLLALLLLNERLALTIFTPTLAALLGVCYGLAVIAAAATEGLPSMYGGPSVTAASVAASRAAPRSAPIALILLAFALRLGGLLHPHTLINDIGLHANNLLGLSSYPGDIYFTEGLPSDAGGGQSPYPPGTYLLLTPFQLLFQPSMEHRLMLLKIGVSLMDSLVVGLIWLMLSRAGMGRRGAFLGAALYLAPPPLLSSFSIGEFANIGGQALALPVLAMLAEGRRQKADGNVAPAFCLLPSAFYLLPLLCIALLAHMGVTISLLCLLVALWGLWALAALLWGKPWRRCLLRLTVVGVLAALAVGVFYYSAPVFVAIFAQRLGLGPAVPSVAPISSLQSATLRLFGPLLGIFTRNSRLMPLLVALGLLGVAYLTIGMLYPTSSSKSGRHDAPSFALLLLAWWLGTLLSLALLLVANQGVRWQHFLYPALCLGAGPALAALWRRGGAGRIAALAGTLAPICYGVAFWVAQLRNYLH